MTFMTIMHWLQDYSVAFVGVAFLVLVASVYWPGRRARFDRDAMIPLQDDKHDVIVPIQDDK